MPQRHADAARQSKCGVGSPLTRFALGDTLKSDVSAPKVVEVARGRGTTEMGIEVSREEFEAGLVAANARVEALEAERRAATSTEGLLRDLRVREVELERQNEALRKAQVALEQERRRNDLLAALSTALAGVNEVRPVLKKLVEVLVPRLGDRAAIHARTSLPEQFASQEGPRRFTEAPPGLEALGPGPTMTLPLWSGNQTFGVIQVTRVEPTRRYGSDDESLAREFASRAMLAIENARLHEIAARAIAARDDMVALVTHDLRHFLNTIVLGARALSDASRPSEPPRELDAIRRATSRMGALVDTLQDAAMMEAGVYTVKARREQIGEILKEAVGTMRPHADARRIELSLDAPVSLPALMCDRERLHLVLMNLIGNAIVHTPSAGRVTVNVVVSADDVVVSVSDTGSGIAPDDVSHVFERDWHKREGGTGLGLYVAKQIIEAHRGRIWVASEAGTGSTFRFSIPVAPVAALAKCPVEDRVNMSIGCHTTT